MSPFYNQCCRHKGKAVAIRTREGRVHRGIIHRVSPTHVYLQPLPSRNLGGYGYGWGWGGYGWGVALGTIVGLSLLPAFWI
ncbi:hypothetical protein HNQ94_002205 [Salirhabdus euzebyi]|uniref:Uncharacterized protein n=1 Tax=Salirhabdus euzebyi TaxID=394506 RepID=A0A841Q5V1_9BACI|nr:DUF2642 domain-containing protein [Salirhabdus euzebyi]MBB6453754.1 hypothetical protein [Salirhabdus euzebyi]